MKPRTALALLILPALAAGCRSHKEAAAPLVVTETRSDSVRVETIYKEVVTKDTVWYPLPRQREEVVTRDSVSFLENDYALSTASLGADGMIRHTLELKQTAVPVPVDTKTITRDSMAYREKITTIPILYPYPYTQASGEASTWHKIYKLLFWVIIIFVIISVFWKYRRPITALGKKLAKFFC